MIGLLVNGGQLSESTRQIIALAAFAAAVLVTAVFIARPTGTASGQVEQPTAVPTWAIPECSEPVPTDTPAPSTDTPLPTASPAPSEVTDAGGDLTATSGTPSPSPEVPTSSVEPSETPTPTPSTNVITADGATIANSSGDVVLAFPPGAVSEPVSVSVGEAQLCPELLGGRSFLSVFSLEARLVSDPDSSVSEFKAPVELSVQLTPADLLPYGRDSLKLVTLNETTWEWETVKSEANYDQGLVTASLNHFSNYGLQAAEAVVLPAIVEPFQTDAHSGAATTAIPLNLPPGPGGFGPNLTLSYSSAAVDEMKSKQATGSWAGVGWNLGVPSISRDPFTGRYNLSMPGGSGLLISETNSFGTDPFSRPKYRWHTQADQYLDITSVRCNAGEPIMEYDQFTIRTKDGTEYQFGTTPGGPSCPLPQFAGTALHPTSLQFFADLIGGGVYYSYYRMDVSEIKDRSGNRVQFTYFQDIYDADPGEVYAAFTKAAYPDEIWWGDSSSFTHHVKFSSSWDWNGAPCSSSWTVRRDAALNCPVQTCPDDPGILKVMVTCPHSLVHS